MAQRWTAKNQRTWLWLQSFLAMAAMATMAISWCLLVLQIAVAQNQSLELRVAKALGSKVSSGAGHDDSWRSYLQGWKGVVQGLVCGCFLISWLCRVGDDDYVVRIMIMKLVKTYRHTDIQIHTYVRMYVHTDIRTQGHMAIWTYGHMDIPTSRQPGMQTCRNAQMHSCANAPRLKCTHARMHTCTYANMQTFIHAYMHTDMHTYAYTHMQIHRHTDTQKDRQPASQAGRQTDR